MFRIASETENEATTDSELKPRLRRRNLSPRKKLCPECLSELKLKTTLSGWLVPDYYICLNCGYSGYVALEETTEKK